MRGIKSLLREGGVSKHDIIIIAALLGLSLALGIVSVCTLRSGSDCRAVVTRGGEAVVELPLSEDAEYIIDDGEIYCEIEVRSGEVSMAHSSCADKLCVRAGSISRGGETIVCLPCRVVITVVSGDSDEYLDSVVY